MPTPHSHHGFRAGRSRSRTATRDPRRLPILECLELRRLLSGSLPNYAPITTDDTFTTLQDQPLLPLSTERTTFSLNGTLNGRALNGTWTNANALFWPSGTPWSVTFHYEGLAPASREYFTLSLRPPSFYDSLQVGRQYSFADSGAVGLVLDSLALQLHGELTTGTGDFTVRQLDTGANSEIRRLTVDFHVANAPTGTDVTGTLEYRRTGNVLANDVDVNGDVMTATLATGPSHGTLALDPGGSFRYVPDPGFAGTDSFTYVASDGQASAFPAVATIRVIPINHAPTFVPGPDQVVDEDTGWHEVAGWAAEVSPGPSPSDDGQYVSLTATSDNPGLFAQQPMIGGDGTLFYSLKPNAHGVAHVTVVATDGGGVAYGGRDTSAPRTFTITVNDIPDVPVAQPDAFRTYPGVPLQITTRPAESWVQMYYGTDNLDQVSNFLLPATGGTWPTGDNGVSFGSSYEQSSVTFVPPMADQRFHVGHYDSATDGSRVGLVWKHSFPGPAVRSSFTVLDVGYETSVMGDIVTLTRFAADFEFHLGDQVYRGSVRFNYVPPASVLANDELAETARLVTAPSHGTLAFNADGSFAYTPADGFVGTDTFTYVGVAGANESTPTPVTITVAPGQQPVKVLTGTLTNRYPLPGGTLASTPLAGWTVYVDANDNGSLDPGERTTTTDLDGQYYFYLPAGRHVVRAVLKAGFVADAAGGAAGTRLAATFGPDFVGPDLRYEAPPLTVRMDNPVVIDVVAFYGDSTQDWPTLARQWFREANRVYANSLTNVRLNLLDVRHTDYTASGTLQTDLARVGNPADGFLDDVPVVRDQINADLVVLLAPSVGTGNTAGIAYERADGKDNAARGYAVVAYTGDPTFDGQTVAHEIAHTLGADHDAEHPVQTATAAYAHGFRFTGTDGVTYRDVMAYDPGVVLPFFSSPDLSYAGHALGDASTADVARVIRENAAAVASYRPPFATTDPVTPPDPGGGGGGDPDPNTDPVSGQPTDPGTPPAPEPPPPPRVTPPLPVRVTSVSAPRAPVKPGTAVPLSATLRNDGKAKFSGKAVVAFYLSKDRTLDASDLLLKRVTLAPKNMKPKGTLAATAAGKPGVAWSGGTFYVLAVATGTGAAADERATKPASAALKVAAPPKKKAAAKVVAGGFQSARPIVEQATGPERRSGDADDVITGLLLSSK